VKEVKCKWPDGAVLVCVNERDPATGKSFCGHDRGTSLRNWMKTSRNAEGLKGRILVSVSSCLGVCPRKGTVVAVVPSSGATQMVVVDPDQQRKDVWCWAKTVMALDDSS
jgi:predicted metal-binding protein